jgi:hypothetical protein
MNYILAKLYLLFILIERHYIDLRIPAPYFKLRSSYLLPEMGHPE